MWFANFSTNQPHFSDWIVGRGSPEVCQTSTGAAKASCGETVVQKGVFGESVSSLPLKGFKSKP